LSRPYALPALSTVAVALLGAAGLLWAMGAFQSELVLPIDDGYIHLAVARTLAEHGAWSIDPEGPFTSPSSSPGWVVLLAMAMKLVGPSVWVPVAINAVLSAGFVSRIFRHFASEGVPPLVSAVAAAAVTLATPLPSMTTLGMEHVLHSWLVFEFLLAFDRWLAARGGAVAVVGLAALATIVRYETMFAVAPAVALLAWRRRPVDAVTLAVGAASLALAFGLYSVAKGAWIVPTSVVVKASIGSRSAHVLENLGNPGLMVPMLLTGTLAALTQRPSLGVFAVACMLQLLFARTGWAYRYEAWCVAVGLSLSVPLVWSTMRRPMHTAGILIAVFALLAPRAWWSLVLTPAGSRDVYTVWVAPARVIASMPPRSVGANALGALAWENPGRPILDLDGLDDIEVARHWLHGTWSDEDLRALLETSDTEVLFLSGGWLQTVGRSEPPPDWSLVGTWRADTHYVDTTLSSNFYATSPEAATAVEAALRKAELHLPEEVSVRVEPW
jgi:hypothetical protein